MKKCVLVIVIVVITMVFSVCVSAQNPGKTPVVPEGIGPGPTTPDGSFLQGPPGASMSVVPSGPPTSMPFQEPFGEVFFSAGTVSPDGKFLYVVFDRFLMKYRLPELKLSQKIDIGLAVAPVTPSISISSDGKWIYIIQNGVIIQIENETFKVNKTERLSPIG